HRLPLRAAHRAEHREPGRGHDQLGGHRDYHGDRGGRGLCRDVPGGRELLDAMEKRCLIEVKGLWTRFGEHVVHRDVNVKVDRGEILSLVGGSGSGKTTLLRQMMGLEMPWRGEVKVFGVSLHASDADEVQRIRRRWGVLFQHGALFSALSVYDNVALPLRELGTVDEGLVRELVLLKLRMDQLADE